MTRNELEAKNKKQLQELCKELGLPRYKGKSELTKPELIKSILETETKNNTECSVKENVQSEEKIDSKVAKKKEKEMAVAEDQFQNKVRYIEQAEVGTIIAFYDENGKPNSAALENRSTSRKMLKLVTQYGKEFIVPYDKVIWVRTGNIWPNKVYRLLKFKNAEAEDENN